MGATATYNALVAALGQINGPPPLRRVYVWSMVSRGECWKRDGYMGIHPADWRTLEVDASRRSMLPAPSIDRFMGAPVIFVDGDDEARREAVRNLLGVQPIKEAA